MSLTNYSASLPFGAIAFSLVNGTASVDIGFSMQSSSPVNLLKNGIFNLSPLKDDIRYLYSGILLLQIVC